MRCSIPVCVNYVEALLWLLLRWLAMMTWSLLSGRPREGNDCDRLLPLHRCTTTLDRCSNSSSAAQCLVVTIHNFLLTSILGWHSRSSASVAYPFPYSSIRAILRSSWFRSCAMVIRDGYKGLEWIVTCDQKISSCFLSVMFATCLYQPKSPSLLSSSYIIVSIENILCLTGFYREW
jgi:hypothetical protein